MRKTSRPKPIDPVLSHQLNIARRTLEMPDHQVAVMGGMTKEQARKLLAEHSKET
jgi:hypothetical protein